MGKSVLSRRRAGWKGWMWSIQMLCEIEREMDLLCRRQGRRGIEGWTTVSYCCFDECFGVSRMASWTSATMAIFYVEAFSSESTLGGSDLSTITAEKQLLPRPENGICSTNAPAASTLL
jgi:hypothetical protein